MECLFKALTGFQESDIIGKFKFSEWWHGIMTPDLDPDVHSNTRNNKELWRVNVGVDTRPINILCVTLGSSSSPNDTSSRVNVNLLTGDQWSRCSVVWTGDVITSPEESRVLECWVLWLACAHHFALCLAAAAIMRNTINYLSTLGKACGLWFSWDTLLIRNRCGLSGGLSLWYERRVERGECP